MTYGIKFYGANENLIFDSDRSNVQFLTIDGGTISTGTNASFVPGTEILFARPSASTGNLRGLSTHNNTVTVAFDQNTKFFKAKISNSATTIETGTNVYGLEITEGSNTTVFSTRKTSSSLSVVGIAEPGYVDSSGSTSVSIGTWHGDTAYNAPSGEDTSNVYVNISYIWKNLTYYAQSYVFNSNNIVFYSQIPGPFGAINLPLFGQAVFATVEGG